MSGPLGALSALKAAARLFSISSRCLRGSCWKFCGGRERANFNRTSNNQTKGSRGIAILSTRPIRFLVASGRAFSAKNATRRPVCFFTPCPLPMEKPESFFFNEKRPLVLPRHNRILARKIVKDSRSHMSFLFFRPEAIRLIKFIKFQKNVN